jgi:hypothetical protein
LNFSESVSAVVGKLQEPRGLYHYEQCLFDFKLSCGQGCGEGSFAHEPKANEEGRMKNEETGRQAICAGW